MSFTLRKIRLSDLLEGADLKVTQDAEIAFAGKLVTPLQNRIVPVSTADQLDEAQGAKGIAALIAPPELAQNAPEHLGLVLSADPMAALAQIQGKLAAHPDLQWERFESRIHPTAQISDSAQIAPYDVIIGAATRIAPGVVVEPRSEIGARCMIGAQTHIGGPGFHKDTGAPGHLLAQSGGVRIGDDVTIQSSCVISRALFGGFTTIERKVLIDSLVSVSHDCSVGTGTIICAKVSLSGGAQIGKSAYLGPNSTISNGIKIGEGGQVSLGATVTKDVPAGEKVSGNFALPHDTWLNFIRQVR